MTRRPPRSTPKPSSAASDVYKRQPISLPICVRCFQNLRETNKPLALASRPTSIGPDRRRTLAHGSTYAPTTRAVKMQLAPHAVPSSSVDEVQPASSCRCRCRPAGDTAETTAVDRNHSSRNHSSTPASAASLSIGRGDVVRTARVPLLYPCRYAREKLSVRESDRRCPPLAFCPNVFPSVEPTTIVNVCIQFAGFEQN